MRILSREELWYWVLSKVRDSIIKLLVLLFPPIGCVDYAGLVKRFRSNHCLTRGVDARPWSITAFAIYHLVHSSMILSDSPNPWSKLSYSLSLASLVKPCCRLPVQIAEPPARNLPSPWPGNARMLRSGNSDLNQSWVLLSWLRGHRTNFEC